MALKAIKGPIVKFGTINRWNGPRKGFSYYPSIEEAIQSDYDRLLYLKEGTLFMSESHHDGINYFEMLTTEFNEDDFVDKVFANNPVGSDELFAEIKDNCEYITI